MNFLSHLYLAGNSEGLIIGNYIGDSVKGCDYKNYSNEIQKGILLHRAIDTFTDSHEIVELSKNRLRDKYKKYSGVIVDIYYDHFLAKNWNNYSNISLNEFTQTIYSIIKKHFQILPYKSARFTEYMLHYNILENYANLQGIEQVLKGMSQRASFKSNMEKSIDDLKEHFSDFENEFNMFFPDLKNYVNSLNLYTD